MFTTRGSALQKNPLYIVICLPLPSSPPEQLSTLLMQFSIQVAMTTSSHAPNQSACSEVPGFIIGMPGMVSDDSDQVEVSGVHLPERSRSASTVYQAPMVKVGMTYGWVVGHLNVPQLPWLP